jgi:hypothetical protein
MAEGACCNPVNHNAPYPHKIPMACPQSALRGQALGNSGDANNKKAVGPSDGNTSGTPQTIARTARTAMVAKLLINTTRTSKALRAKLVVPSCLFRIYRLFSFCSR